MQRIIDTHIHLDQYKDEDIQSVLYDDPLLQTVIAVSTDRSSCHRTLHLAEQFDKVKPAFGWHPEQELIGDEELNLLIDWMEDHKQKVIAIGEVGLPYYRRKKYSTMAIGGYLDVLDSFILLAKKWNKPIILHAVYEDAPIVCDLLEKHSIKRAHFHWFKGDKKTVHRMLENNYMISITPDVLYEEEIQKLVQLYSLQHMMVETDGPWPFAGPLKNQKTHPTMMHRSIDKIASLKNLPVKDVYLQLYQNTIKFYETEEFQR